MTAVPRDPPSPKNRARRRQGTDQAAPMQMVPPDPPRSEAAPLTSSFSSAISDTSIPDTHLLASSPVSLPAERRSSFLAKGMLKEVAVCSQRGYSRDGRPSYTLVLSEAQGLRWNQTAFDVLEDVFDDNLF